MRARLPAVFVGLATLTALVVMPVRDGAARAADPVDRQLDDVVAIAADDAWAVGGDLLVHWDGAAWTAVDPGILRQHRLTAVAANGPDDVWVVGTLVSMERNLPLVMHFDGATWERVYVPRPDGDAILQDVVVRPSGEVWVVGYWTLWTPTFNDDGALAYRSDGSTWRRVKVPGEVTYLGAASPSGANGLWAVGWLTDPLTHPAALRWNGSSWRVHRLPEPSDDNLATDVVALGPGRVWVVGSAWRDLASDWLDGVYIARWNGRRWTTERTTPEAALSAVSAGPGGALVAVGQARPDFRAMAMTRDTAGWRRVTVPAPARESALLGIDVRTGTDAWAVGRRQGTDGWADPMAMHWDGSAWTRVPMPTT